MSHQDDPTRVGDLLDPVGRRIGVDDAVALGKLSSRWRDLVGESVADHARPTSLKRGVLRLRVASPVWATEIGFLSRTIRSQVNAELGSGLVKDVRVYIAPDHTERNASREGGPNPLPPVATVSGEGGSDPRVAFERAREAWQEWSSRHRGEDHSAGESTW